MTGRVWWEGNTQQLWQSWQSRQQTHMHWAVLLIVCRLKSLKRRNPHSPGGPPPYMWASVSWITLCAIAVHYNKVG